MIEDTEEVLSESDESDFDFDDAVDGGRPSWDMFQLIPRERISYVHINFIFSLIDSCVKLCIH